MTEDQNEEQKNESATEVVESGVAGDVRSALRSVKDPEIDLNVVDLGLIYDIEIIERKAYIQMTLTSPGCPAGPEIVADAERAAGAVDGVDSVAVEIVWEPFWRPGFMTEAAKIEAGIFF